MDWMYEHKMKGILCIFAACWNEITCDIHTHAKLTCGTHESEKATEEKKNKTHQIIYIYIYIYLYKMKDNLFMYLYWFLNVVVVAPSFACHT